MTCSLCRLTWGCQSSVRPAEEGYPPGFFVLYDHVVVLVAGSDSGSDVDGGELAVVVDARWEMACGYV